MFGASGWVSVMRSALGTFLLGLTITVCQHPAVKAASLANSLSKDGKVVITLTGEIAEGDSDQLKTIVKTANDRGRLVSAIRLDSPGGSIAEAARIAEIVRYGKIATVIGGGTTCASACFVVFAAGSPKYVSYSALVGVHGASDAEGRETVEAGATTVLMARALKDLGVPAPILGKMVVTTPDTMVWLTPDDLRSMGTTMTGKPAQVPSQQSGPEPPIQLDPNARATAPNQGGQTKPTRGRLGNTWDEIVNGAIALSKRQNGGQLEANRGCQPEMKLCSMAIFFKANDGATMMIRKAEDVSGRTLKRDICEFNEFGDIRTCIDFDTGETSKEMKNEKKEWVKVGD